MKCLSIRQPYASRIIRGEKQLEFRRWSPSEPLVGFRLAIHAAKTPEEGGEALPRGVVIGTVQVMGIYLLAKQRNRPNVIETLPGSVRPFFQRWDDSDELEPGDAGMWVWLFDHPRALPRPLPVRGHVRLFDVPL